MPTQQNPLATAQILIAEAYSAFNRRDIDAALALMSENVSWPKASEGGRVAGKEEIRAYWTRQWKEFDPHVEPVEVIDREGSKTHVKVHQLVKSLSGDVLSDTDVWHIYTIANGLIERMDLGESDPSSQQTPSTAFSRSSYFPAQNSFSWNGAVGTGETRVGEESKSEKPAWRSGGF
jgi:hypothetical protein